MQKTLFVTHWPGGGVWGLAQLVQAAYTEEQTGMRMCELSDLHISSSIGAVAGNGLLIPSDTNPSLPKFKANDLIEPFKDCAAQMFGPDGIQAHYTHTVKHDLAKMIKGERGGLLRSGIARFLSSPKNSIHKPHDLLGIFLANYIGDMRMNQLIGSSITLAHHMETTSRVCFANLTPDTFDMAQWDHDILPNHGAETRVADAVMASTAAPTVFNSHAIGDNHYVDFDKFYSPLSVIETAQECIKAPHPQLTFQKTPTKMLKMSCGLMFDATWDHAEHANHGPLAMYSDMLTAIAVDQQRQDHARLKKHLGKDGLVVVGSEISSLARETETMPSTGAFNGNYSNLRKIEDFAHREIVVQREKIMRYAEMVTETRAREGKIDPLGAFDGVAANKNNHMPVNPPIKEEKPNIAAPSSQQAAESGWAAGLSRLLGRRGGARPA